MPRRIVIVNKSSGGFGSGCGTGCGLILGIALGLLILIATFALCLGLIGGAISRYDDAKQRQLNTAEPPVAPQKE